jgi:elongation factor 1-beta
MSQYSIKDVAHLGQLDAQLKDNLYIGGQFPSAEDALVFEQFLNEKTEPEQDSHPNLFAWYGLVTLFIQPVRDSWKNAKPAEKKEEKKPATKEAPKKKEEPKKEEAPKADDDDMDLFGEETEEEKEKLAKMKQEKEQKPKLPAKTVIAKSLIILDVKVWEPDQDLDSLAQKICQLQKDGLFWKTEYKLADVAFGVKKIVIGCVVEDEKVSIDDVIDEIQSWEDEVQSVDIVAFNKI